MEFGENLFNFKCAIMQTNCDKSVKKVDIFMLTLGISSIVRTYKGIMEKKILL